MENSEVPHQKFRYLKPLVYLFAALCLFLSLAEDIVEKERLSFDLPIQLFLHGHATPTLDSIMLVLTHAGSAYALMPLNILIFFLLIHWKLKNDAVFFALSVTGAALLNYAAKLGFARARPDLWVSISPEVTYSFPSGHAMSSLAAAGALIVLTWRSKWRLPVAVVSLSAVIGIGLSRIYLGVHYPSDILSGWAASTAWIAGLVMARRQ